MPNVCVLPDKDCCFNRNAVDTNYNADLLWMDCLYVSGSKTQQMRTLMHWTIPAEVNAGEFYKAFVCLFNVAAPFGSAAAHIFRITQAAWTEAGATWNKYDGVNAWVAAGGDYDGEGTHPHVDVTMPAAIVAGWFEIEVTDMVTDAITNHSRSLDLMFILDNENPASSIQFYWWNKDQPGSPERRPYLNIIRPPFGLPMQV